MNETVPEYRALLQQLENEQLRSYDKTVLSLSGGALGISIAFIKDIVPLQTASESILLVIAWAFWGMSMCVVLISYFISAEGLRAAIKAFDKGEKPTRAHRLDAATYICNILGGIFFLFGVFILICFINVNVGRAHEQEISRSATSTEASANPRPGATQR